jgi:ribosomal-protein-alanine N-acetyltransferase
MSFAIRSMSEGDVDQVLQLERESEGAAHWPRSVYEEMCLVQRDDAVGKLALVAKSDGRIVGFVAGRVVLDEAEIENIFVSPEFQRQGIARELLCALVENFRTWGAVEVRLEVREGNQAALAFYEAAGLAIVGRRQRYYLDPEEDALLLRMKLQPTSAECGK